MGTPLREIREIENVWIPMSDGTKIAARMWLPVDAETDKVPAIMEYIPYRKRDGTRPSDDPRHSYWAKHGYACIRPDIRGSGDSDGIQIDEYVKQEQDDGVEIIAWIARQPWCNGSVGLVGISWGGFSSLQVAARHPPALKAIMTHCSTDDRYADDAHYIGGCVVQDMFGWGGLFFGVQSGPPDPEIVGADRWRPMWMERLEKLQCRVADWMTHQHRDAFWKHGSVRENYDDIHCAVYAVGGWVDPYSTAIPRLLAGLKGPRKGLIGPWGHNYPENGVPGPAENSLDDSLRWWDHWLKGIDTGIMKEPMLRVWMQGEAACCGMTETPGRWVAEREWPSKRIQQRTYALNGNGIAETKGAVQRLELAPAQTTGMGGGHWCAFDMATELPKDQQMDDGRSICFDSPALTERMEILGAPVVHLSIEVDRPVAMVAVRLNEVHADQSCRRVTYGVLNLTHRDSHEFPTALEPGKRYHITVPLKDIAHSFSPGSRIRVAVSSSYWPMVFPMPEAVKLAVYTGESELKLPLRPPSPEDAKLVTPGPPTQKYEMQVASIGDPIPGSKVASLDVATGKMTIRSTGRNRHRRLTQIGTIRKTGFVQVMEIDDRDPAGATIVESHRNGWERGKWQVDILTEMKMTMTRTHFLLHALVEAKERDKSVFTREWNHEIPRLLV